MRAKSDAGIPSESATTPKETTTASSMSLFRALSAFSNDFSYDIDMVMGRSSSGISSRRSIQSKPLFIYAFESLI